MFYRLCWPADGKYATCSPYLPVYETKLDDVCPLCGRNLAGRYWQHPRVLKITGKRFPDFMFSTPYPAVSEKFRNAYEKSNLKGILSFDEIEHYHLNRGINANPKYYTIKVVRSRLEIDYANSTISWSSVKHSHFCSLCDPKSATISKIGRLAFHEGGDNGEDIFTLCPTGNALYLSEKFIAFVKENRLTNLGVRPLNNLEKTIVL